ncbi:unnamed protein product [Caenorhabditis auriculariae]|uniref:BEACH domain-containing protein n=1 Tax=Caenorhabditis auriculariae TaxID=2777116 RepID=A0A8S1H2X9_9PELO|nr:unnamed protein product [Caenorhabditis auriculariae]
MFTRQPSHHVSELLSDIGYMVYRARIESKENLCKHVRSKWVPEEYPASLTRMYAWTPDECIPELYEDPKIIVSKHHDMPDLQLPPFVDSPEEFITWHRNALENEEVSSQLHRWIDIVFGYQVEFDWNFQDPQRSSLLRGPQPQKASDQRNGQTLRETASCAPLR